MKYEYLKIIKEQGEFDFEVSALVEELTQEEYEQLKSMLITAIGTMEEMRRNKKISDVYLICARCGKQDKSVKKCIDPYDKEINEILTFTELCDDCYQERVYEI